MGMSTCHARRCKYQHGLEYGLCSFHRTLARGPWLRGKIALWIAPWLAR